MKVLLYVKIIFLGFKLSSARRLATVFLISNRLNPIGQPARRADFAIPVNSAPD